ncbi:MAG: DUF6477 family protein [Pseudomonadota bacterium]
MQDDRSEAIMRPRSLTTAARKLALTKDAETDACLRRLLEAEAECEYARHDPTATYSVREHVEILSKVFYHLWAKAGLM